MGTHSKSDRKAREAKQTRQRTRTEPNRIRKLLKHLRKHPNDLQATPTPHKSKEGIE